ncbi:MAG: response regulator [Gemmatimonadota bacterium]
MANDTRSGLRLLVVDDNRMICWALEREFADGGFVVTVCGDGQGARRTLRATTYDVAILDVHLPDADGIAILGEIKRLSPPTRTVVITADATPANIRRAIAAGADLLVEKPFDPSAVRGRVLDMFRDYPVPRRHPRHACRFPVRLSLLAPVPPGAGFEPNGLTGLAEDVGGGGLRVATEHPLAAGQTVRVRTADVDAADPYPQFVGRRATAEVRWTTMAPGGFRAGLSFTTPTALPEA